MTPVTSLSLQRTKGRGPWTTSGRKESWGPTTSPWGYTFRLGGRPVGVRRAEEFLCEVVQKEDRANSTKPSFGSVVVSCVYDNKEGWTFGEGRSEGNVEKHCFEELSHRVRVI